MIDAIAVWDAQALLFIQESLRFAPLDAVMRFITRLGDGGLIWIVLGIVLLIYKRTRVSSLHMLPTLAIATALNNLVIKRIIARVRPYEMIEGLTILIEKESSWSFPSGHSCSGFAAATALFLAYRGRGGGWAFIPAALVALSRAYVGVHYLTDILAGALVGTLVALTCYKIYRRILLKRQGMRGKS